MNYFHITRKKLYTFGPLGETGKGVSRKRGTLVLKQLVAIFLKSVSVFLLANFENFHDY
jgi:hypothetical protein